MNATELNELRKRISEVLNGFDYADPNPEAYFEFGYFLKNVSQEMIDKSEKYAMIAIKERKRMCEEEQREKDYLSF